MDKNDKQILLGLAALGITFLLVKSKKTVRKDEKQEIEIGALPIEYKRVGRIKMTVAHKAKIKAGDIVVHPNYIRHIELAHAEELESLGISAVDYISIIANNFTQIRKGSGDSILLVVKNNHKNDVLALQLTPLIDDKGKELWEIHTSQPRNKFSQNQTVLWEK